MELEKATIIAERTARELEPFCERLQIAGSIRRKKPFVKDIEVVCMPKTYEQKDLFGEEAETKPVPGFVDLVNSWDKVKGDPNGRYTQRVLPDGATLDLFMATRNNWGNMLMIRTGSWEFSKWMMGSVVKKNGYIHVEGYLYEGYVDDQGEFVKESDIIPVLEEEDLFEMLGMDFVKPEDRNGKIRARKKAKRI